MNEKGIEKCKNCNNGVMEYIYQVPSVKLCENCGGTGRVLWIDNLVKNNNNLRLDPYSANLVDMIVHSFRQKLTEVLAENSCDKHIRVDMKIESDYYMYPNLFTEMNKL